MQKYHVETAARRRPNILYIDKYKLIYCVIPKVGCTNWKKVFLYLSGKLKSDIRKEVEQDKWFRIPGSVANDPSHLGQGFKTGSSNITVESQNSHTSNSHTCQNSLTLFFFISILFSVYENLVDYESIF